MSEEILKALTQLFAIITKQDGGVTENERQFVINFFQQELDQDTVKEYVTLYDDFSGWGKADEEKNKLEDKLEEQARDHSVRLPLGSGWTPPRPSHGPHERNSIPEHSGCE